MSYSSFPVLLDDCTFLKGSQITEREIYIGTQGSLGALDFEKNIDHLLELVIIKVQKKIGDLEYEFYSPPYSTSIDNLSIRIEFLKSIIVHYKEQDPSEYFFECK